MPAQGILDMLPIERPLMRWSRVVLPRLADRRVAEEGDFRRPETWRFGASELKCPCLLVVEAFRRRFLGGPVAATLAGHVAEQGCHRSEAMFIHFHGKKARRRMIFKVGK